MEAIRFMNERKVRGLVIITAIMLLCAGAVLFFVFDKQGMNKHKTNGYINYDVNDYVEITPVVFNTYNDVYSSINVSKINFRNISDDLTKTFMDKEEEIINYITGYYNEIKSSNNYFPTSSVSSTIKTQMNGAVLSVFYRLDFNLSESIFGNDVKSYVVTLNVDLGTDRILANDELLSKYNYTRSYIADKLFNDDVLIEKNMIVIDRNTNMSLTRSDIERKKEEYIQRIISEFDNIIDMYIENGSLVLIYDTRELKGIFFENEFESDLKFRYLK
jgi:hypothetical protein